MIDFSLHTNEGAPEGSRATLGVLQEKLGFVPNVLRQMAEAPAALHGAAQLLGTLEGSSLRTAEQQVVLLVAARQYTSEYCVAANSTVAEMRAVPPEVIEGVRKNEPLADPRLEALRRFAGEMVRERGRVSEETTQAFFEAGFTKAQVLEVILGIATETMASYTDRVAGVPMDEQFRARAWRTSERGSRRRDS